MSRMDTAPASSSHDAPGQGARQTYVAERQRNPFVRSARGGRLLSALQLPWFTLLPPAGYGVLTTIGRRTGRQRRKCVRAIRRGDVAFVVAIRPTAWLKNLRANPEVVVHLESGEDVLILEGRAEELRGIDRALFDKIDEQYAAKYDYRPRDNLSGPDDVPYPDGGLFAMRPRTAFAWSGFPADATRYRFSDE